MKARRYTGRPALATLALGFVRIILADFGAERQSRAVNRNIAVVF
jgi:hypothetical protein